MSDRTVGWGCAGAEHQDLRWIPAVRDALLLLGATSEEGLVGGVSRVLGDLARVTSERDSALAELAEIRALLTGPRRGDP